MMLSGADYPAVWTDLTAEIDRVGDSGDRSKLVGIANAPGNCSPEGIRRIVKDALARGIDPRKAVAEEPAIAVVCGIALQSWYTNYTGVVEPLKEKLPDVPVDSGVVPTAGESPAGVRTDSGKQMLGAPAGTGGFSSNTLLIAGAVILGAFLLRGRK